MLKTSKVRSPIAIGLGAIAGALCRYYVSQGLEQLAGTDSPVGTLVVNLSGCFLIGIITTLAINRLLFSPELILLLTTGFLGAYTTFSSYELDTIQLLEEDVWQAFAYWISGPLLGLLFFNIGRALTGWLSPSTHSNDY
ncbi:MAG: fluoride efflux transporter CrcB [Cyanobacteria bacterium P01_E01_bin.6]